MATAIDIERLSNTEIGGWLLKEVIGRGADGLVYSGVRDQCRAAIKLYYPDQLAKNGIEAARERLELQLALVGKKHHPSLVEIYGGGELPDLKTLYLVMELVPGSSLDKLVGRIPPLAVATLAGQLASAAECLERLELVHRDIKPANIMISEDCERLTLLDLGIVHQPASDDEGGRLSGAEFVATLRYSPHEFVWREEQEELEGAWRAVTFYQIGATLHDMIMGKMLFDGHDKPRACLYDAVRERTPVIESKEIDSWLIETVKACLLKDWRQRLQLVCWASFVPPPIVDAQLQERRIRIHQMRNVEMRLAAQKQLSRASTPTRTQELWNINTALILELRTYLLDAQIFPKCSVNETAASDREYQTRFSFECDLSRNFPLSVVFTVVVAVDAMVEQATKLSFSAKVDEQEIAAATWTEMFTVESAFVACRQSFLNAVEQIVSG